ncbi:MAG TPA: universal stress protein, partial [Vineibacter sp.]|nr:universal stress protein [Vineibacter sp.]
MSYKTIVVHCDAGAAGVSRLKYAVNLARQHEAHLIGLSVAEPIGQTPLTESTYIVELLRQHRERLAAQQVDLADAFARATSGSGLRVEWRVEEGEPQQALATAMRYADLGVLGQFEPNGPTPDHWRAMPESVAMASGRPILVVPYIGAPPAAGGHMLLAWNASHQAARAASDALPMLRAAA